MTPLPRPSVSPLPSYACTPFYQPRPQPFPFQLATIMQWIVPRLRPRNRSLIRLEAMVIDEIADQLEDEPQPHGTAP